MSDPKKCTVIISPRFRYIGEGASSDLGEQLPGIVTTELVNSGHFVVVARQEALEALTQTINRISAGDYIEAHAGGTVIITQNVKTNVGEAELKELSLLHGEVRSQLMALGVDYVVYGKYYDAPDGELRIDIYGLEVDEATLQGAEPVRGPKAGIERAVQAAAGRLAARIRRVLEERRQGGRRMSLAVLPFESLDPQAKWSEWSSGLTEELIMALKNARELQLFDRARTRKYRDADQDSLDLAELGRELQVDLLLLGKFSVNEATQQVRVLARLVKTENEEVLTTFRLTGGMDDDTQAELARQIMEKLAVQPAAANEMKSVHTENVSARDYLRIGLHHIDEGALEKALSSLREALKLDPKFVEAHYQLALLLKELKDYDEALKHFDAALGGSMDMPFGKQLWALDTGSNVWARPVLHEGRVYAGNEAGAFCAADRETGTVLWRADLYANITSAPHLFSQVAVVAAEGSAFGLDGESGAVLWTTALKGNCEADVIGDGNLAIITTNENTGEETFHGRMYALDASTGEVRWEKEADGKVCAPYAQGGKVIAAWQDDSVKAFSTTTGESLWAQKIEGEIASAPVGDNERIYFISNHGYLAALRWETGSEVWRLTIEGLPSKGRLCLDREVLYGAVDDRLHAIDIKNGELQWTFQSYFRIGAVAAGEGLLFLTSLVSSIIESGEHLLVAIDPETRPRRQAYWKRTFGDTLYAEITVAEGVVYVPSRYGSVYAINIQRTEVGPIRAAEIWDQIGLLRQASGKKRQAVLALEQAVALNPAHQDSYRHLVELYLEDGRMAKAIESQQRYLDFVKGEQGEDEAQRRIEEMSGLLWTAPTAPLLPLALLPEMRPSEEQVVLSSLSPITPSPAVIAGDVYIGGTDGIMRRLDCATGKEVWTYKVEGEASIRSTAALSEGRVYFGSGLGEIHALDAETGDGVWGYRTEGRVDSSPAVHAGLLFAGSDDRRLYALDAMTGKLRWLFQTEGQIKSHPAFEPGIVCFGSYDGRIYAVNPDDGTERWRFQTGDIINSSPRIADGKVFVGADDGNVYALDAQDGKLIWKFKVDEQTQSVLDHGLVTIDHALRTFGFLPSSPAVSGGVVYAGSNGESACHLYALDCESGKLRWLFQVEEGELASPTVWANVIFFGAGGITSPNPHLYAVDAREGGLLWKFRTTGDVLSAPIVQDDTVFCWCTSGDVYSFRVSQIPKHKPEHDADFYRKRARVLSNDQRYAEAIDGLLSARAASPNNVLVLAELADCYQANGQIAEQREALLEAQRIDKSSTASYSRLGQIYLQEDNFDAAIEQFQIHIRVISEAGKAIGHVMLGQALLARGDFEQALAEWETGIEKAARFLSGRFVSDADRRNAIAALRLLFENATMAMFEHDQPLAPRLDLKLLEAAGLDDAETRGIYAIVAGSLSEQAKDYASSAIWFRRALKVEPWPKDQLIQVGSILHDKLHRYERAYSLYKIMLEQDPADLALQLSAAESALNSGHVEEVAEFTTAALKDTKPLNVFGARLFRLLALLPVKDKEAFESEMKAFAGLTANLPESIATTWSFAGTAYAIENGTLPDAPKKWALRLLASLGPKFDREELVSVASSRPF